MGRISIDAKPSRHHRNASPATQARLRTWAAAVSKKACFSRLKIVPISKAAARGTRYAA
jgi:hypothetical protein